MLAKGLAMLGSLAFALALVLGVSVANAGSPGSDAAKDCRPARGDAVIASCTEIIARDPNFAPAYFNRGIAYAHKGEHGKAIADYSKTIELDPNIVQAYHRRGTVYAKTGDTAHAIADYAMVIEIDPGNERAYVNRGAAYERTGKTREAIADYRKALALDPNDDYAKEGLQRLGAD